MRSFVRSSALVAVTLSLPAAALAQSAFFGGIGELEGGTTSSAAYGLSGNGLVVVGESFDADGLQAIRYARAAGLKKLDRLTGNLALQGHTASAVNFDGTLVAGDTSGSAVRWNAAGAITKMGDLSGGSDNSSAFAVSADGRYVAGAGTNAQGKGPARWQMPDTIPQQIQGLPGGPGGFAFYGQINDIDANATVFVGSSASANTGNATQLQEAYYYTGTAGGVALGDLPGGRFNSRALAVSGDGAVIVGHGSVGPNSGLGNRHAFRWTAATGMVDLGVYLNGVESVASAISADGLTIGGFSSTSTQAAGGVATVWTAAAGWKRADAILQASGLSTAGWELNDVTGVESIGGVLYMCGNGYHDGAPEGWYAAANPVPEPSALAALGLGALAMLRRRKRG